MDAFYYSRLETLDALDKLPQLINSDELKNKLLFSVVVVRTLLLPIMMGDTLKPLLCLVKMKTVFVTF